jgi:hypothetical protein
MLPVIVKAPPFAPVFTLLVKENIGLNTTAGGSMQVDTHVMFISF